MNDLPNWLKPKGQCSECGKPAEVKGLCRQCYNKQYARDHAGRKAANKRDRVRRVREAEGEK